MTLILWWRGWGRCKCSYTHTQTQLYGNSAVNVSDRAVFMICGGKQLHGSSKVAQPSLCVHTHLRYTLPFVLNHPFDDMCTHCLHFVHTDLPVYPSARAPARVHLFKIPFGNPKTNISTRRIFVQ